MVVNEGRVLYSKSYFIPRSMTNKYVEDGDVNPLLLI